ncbi:Integrase, catalytic core [Corchorus capsularis]|uniref:Integrase, catalytic core n=1 Tax=Corchorus capsularis TaxID=210143 RepID=A0A1R3KEM0_COCAP|nr:Integrase, catalytic core [Corchorus capsularis]
MEPNVNNAIEKFPIGLTAEQYTQLLNLLNGKTSSISSGNLAGESTHSSRIVDSGATDHMTPFLSVLNEIFSTPLHQPVKLPNGASLPVSHVGKAIVSHDIILKDVLCVPNFSCNLLSISKLTKDLNCVELFFPDFCGFQDLHSRKPIGAGHPSLDRLAKISSLSPFIFVKDRHTQFNSKVCHIRSDNGKEFDSDIMRSSFHSHGISHQTSCVATPQQNGVVERKHRHLLELARALHFQAHLPLKFWGECILTATYLINLIPTPVLDGRTPYEILYGKVPSYTHLRVFGCLCYAHNHSQSRHKFDTRAFRCVFLGYPYGQKGYKVYDLESKKIFVSRDVVFHEHIYPFLQPTSEPNPISSPHTPLHSTIIDDPEVLATNSNIDHITETLNNTQPFTSQEIEPPEPEVAPQPNTNSNSLSPSIRPRRSIRDEKWREAMANEIAALEQNETWTLENFPVGKKEIDSKWVYQIKYKPDGTVERYKARLVAKGYTQVEGLDYHEIFPPVAKLVTVRSLLAIASIKNWTLQKLDVNNAFLHGDLHEEVYMKIPQGFARKGETKDLDSLKYFLGIEVARSPSGIVLNQRKYALDILNETGMLGCRPCLFPMEQNHHLEKASGPILADPSLYRRLVGRLLYLTVTRPDLCYSIQVLSQFLHSPRQEHLYAVMRVLRYIKCSPGQGIILPSNGSLEFKAYCDSDWAGCSVTRRSTTGYFILLGSSPISWKSKKQTTVSRSSADVEYHAMSTTTSELFWLRSLLHDLQVSQSSPMLLHCDNQAAIQIAANPIFHERTKHIEVDCHFVREQIQSKELATTYIPSAAQLADIFTKALGCERFTHLLSKSGIINLHAPT